MGRQFRPGSNYTAAEAAYRAAEKLDPADKANIANLAILLEYNRWGLRYGPGARLSDAVAEYRKLTAEDLAGLGVQNNLAFALFYGGEFMEARKNAGTLNPKPNALIVACETATNDLAGARAFLDWLREDEHLPGGDDPLAGAGFPRFWTRGKSANASVMKLAAASILVETKETAAQGVMILEAAKKSVTNEPEKTNIALALVIGYQNLREFEKALAVCNDLTEQYPESRQIFLNRTLFLIYLSRFDEINRLAKDRLQRIPGTSTPCVNLSQAPFTAVILSKLTL